MLELSFLNKLSLLHVENFSFEKYFLTLCEVYKDCLNIHTSVIIGNKGDRFHYVLLFEMSILMCN